MEISSGRLVGQSIVWIPILASYILYKHEQGSRFLRKVNILQRFSMWLTKNISASINRPKKPKDSWQKYEMRGMFLKKRFQFVLPVFSVQASIFNMTVRSLADILILLHDSRTCFPAQRCLFWNVFVSFYPLRFAPTIYRLCTWNSTVREDKMAWKS